MTKYELEKADNGWILNSETNSRRTGVKEVFPTLRELVCRLGMLESDKFIVRMMNAVDARDLLLDNAGQKVNE